MTNPKWGQNFNIRNQDNPPKKAHYPTGVDRDWYRRLKAIETLQEERELREMIDDPLDAA